MTPESPVVAAFDFDGTLTTGGSVWKFLVAIAGRPKVVMAGFADLPKILRAAVMGGSSNDRAKEALFIRVLGGLDANHVAKRAAEFGLVHYARRGRPEVRARLELHRKLGHHVVIVSASPEMYLWSVGDLLGADAVIATHLQVEGAGSAQKLTGRFEGPNCRGHEKARRLTEWIATALPPGEARSVWAYGNSAGDRELLSDADVGIDAGRLGRLGKLKRFTRFADAPDPTFGGSGQLGTDAPPTIVPS